MTTDLQKYTILVVDDEEDQQFIYNRKLGKKYDLICCASSDEAIKAVKESSIDLVIMDQLIQGMHGIQTTHELKVIRPTLPVIMCSASEYNISLPQPEHIYDAFYQKPLDFGILEQEIKKYLK